MDCPRPDRTGDWDGLSLKEKTDQERRLGWTVLKEHVAKRKYSLIDSNGYG
jgi:hypothetical protein